MSPGHTQPEPGAGTPVPSLCPGTRPRRLLVGAVFRQWRSEPRGWAPASAPWGVKVHPAGFQRGSQARPGYTGALRACEQRASAGQSPAPQRSLSKPPQQVLACDPSGRRESLCLWGMEAKGSGLRLTPPGTAVVPHSRATGHGPCRSARVSPALAAVPRVTMAQPLPERLVVKVQDSGYGPATTTARSCGPAVGADRRLLEEVLSVESLLTGEPD